MNSITVHVIVEGQTEEFFIRDILAPELQMRGIYLQASFIDGIGGDVRFRAPADAKHMTDCLFRLNSYQSFNLKNVTINSRQKKTSKEAFRPEKC